jgi:hypothetical protein
MYWKRIEHDGDTQHTYLDAGVESAAGVMCLKHIEHDGNTHILMQVLRALQVVCV